jgi:serine O-acetyltransferase
VIRALLKDAMELAKVATKGRGSAVEMVKAVILYDSYAVTASTRVRELARRWHIPVVNRALRLAQTALYGIEIGKDVQLGHGVYFVHSVGTVIGGNAQIGDRVTFMGSNTVGTNKDDGYPVIEEDVVIGCGARILGPVRIGARSVIGANAVVREDVPPDSVAVGIPAKVTAKR